MNGSLLANLDQWARMRYETRKREKNRRRKRLLL